MIIFLKATLKILFLFCWISSSLAAMCSINVVAVNFGYYNPVSAKPNKANGAVKMMCVGEVANYEIMLSPGRGRLYGQRKMYNGNLKSSALNYNLFLDPSYSNIWGNGTSGTGSITGNSDACQRRTPCSYPIYGFIPPLQKQIMAGNYSDNIVVIVSFQ